VQDVPHRSWSSRVAGAATQASRIGTVLQVGDTVPDVPVYLGPNEPITIPELLEDGPKLLVFYLFDWSAT